MPLILPEKAKLLVYIGPLGDQKTKGGIIISSKNVEDECYAATTGTVVEVKSHDPIKDLQIGDKLSFRPYAGIHKVGADGNAYRLLEGREIHAKDISQNNNQKGEK